MIPLLYDTIDVWPGRLLTDSQRAWSPFSGTWESTSTKLRHEAEQLGAKEVRLRLALPEGSLYKDGSGLRADRRGPEHPGAIVVLDTPERGVLIFATDRFTHSRIERAWQSNVRAIALGMEALRKIDRYGIADHGEQFAGFKALGSGIVMSAKPEPLTLEEAVAILAGGSDLRPEAILGDRAAARLAYRKATMALHPDHGGSGDGEKMARLAEAWTLVQSHHGGAS